MATDVERLHYYERQYLGATDFEAQQAYHRDALRRHLLGPHTWGIVTGLELTQDGPDVTIEKGLAVDAYGRTIVLLDRMRLSKDRFDLLPFQATPRWLTVSLRYAEESTGDPAPGFDTCATGDAGYRIRETFRVDLTTEQNPVVVAGAPTDPTTVEADGTLPYQELPEDDRARWTIPIGDVQWQASADPTVPGSFLAVRPDGRIYAGAVAASVLAPAGRVVVRDRSTAPLTPRADLMTVEGALGATGLVTGLDGLDVTGDVNVTLDDTTKIVVGVVDPANPAGPLDSKVEIDHTGKVTTKDAIDVSGTATINGSLEVRDDQGGKSPEMTIARPHGTTDLQVTIGSASNGDNRFVVARSGAPAVEQFVVEDSGDARVGGDLTVNGTVALNSSLSIRDASGGEDTDVLVVSRHRRAQDQNDLRIQIGDNLYGDDRLVVGPVFYADGQFREQFVVDNSGNVSIAGSLRVTGTSNLVVVHKHEFSKQNAGADQPFTWTTNHAGVFAEVYTAFAVWNGFSLWQQLDANWEQAGRWSAGADVNAIPQHAFVRVTQSDLNSTSGVGFVSESLPSNSPDNSVLFTVIVLGRGVV
jgi:hypothetical protein